MGPSFKQRDGMYAVVDCTDWLDFRHKISAYLVSLAQRPKVSGEYLFRGQSCSSWPLVTSFDRAHASLSPVEADERYDAMIDLFGRAFTNYGDLTARDISYLNIGTDQPRLGEWEALAQHYGLATRLLDWSHSLYVAAFFAFSSVNSCDTGLVSVWSLLTSSLKRFSDDHLSARLDIYKQNPRHVWQWGAFLRNKSGEHDLVTLFRSNSRFYSKKLQSGYPWLIRFDIPSSCVHEAMDDLNSMRINSMTIFPGIEGVVRWIRSGGDLER